MEFDVGLDKQHLEALGATAPLTGIIELVWNALDADANEVKVEIVRNDLEGIEEIRVVDDGHGIRADEVQDAFGTLGGSWKQEAIRSRTKDRPLHGREGRGRFRAASIGNRIRWRSIASDREDHNLRHQIQIELRRGNLTHVSASDAERTSEVTGTRVIIDEIVEPPIGLAGEGPIDRLTATFALPLENYNAHLVYDHDEIDPARLQTHRADYTVASDGGSAMLTVIEWEREIERALFLCDENGMPVGQLKAGIQAANFNFTAYLQWTGFKADDATLQLVELDTGEKKDLIDAARDQMRGHFKERARQRTREQIKKWKDENAYPFAGEPANTTAQAVRDVFDVVALSASSVVNNADVSSRRLSLRLIREALEQDPGSLHRVLRDVLDLPQGQLDELSALLERTPLTSLIATSTAITNRLEFLAGLETLVLDPDLKKHVKERSQLHRILAGETWVFGEEYAIAADDESLSNVLKHHLHLLGRPELAEDLENVTDSDGHTRIVDLMLARSLPQNRNRREHLVIELKAPKVKVGDDESAQIKKYASAVSDDPRFNKTEVKWDFIVVSGEVTGTPEKERHSKDRPEGLIMDTDDGIRVWALTWGEIISAAQHRLKFVQERLDYQPSAHYALEYLRLTHEKYLPPEAMPQDQSGAGEETATSPSPGGGQD
jgi:Histidine kinase-, DNA gyrase B-, and HSP90-like ATPase